MSAATEAADFASWTQWAAEEDAAKRAARSAKLVADMQADAARHGAKAKPAAAPAFRFVPVGDLELKPSEFLVDGLIETETLGLLFGDPGCGKSFLAVDLSLSVATDEEFHGHSVRQGPVFYIAGEGHNGLTRRFHAWARDRGMSLDGVPLFKSERAAQFLDAASAQAVADAVTELEKEHGSPALIVIDTVARNFGAGDENSTKDMSEFVGAMDDLKARYPGSVALLVQHSGHMEKNRARGAMALKGALDFEYRLEKEGRAITLTNTKTKDSEPPPDMHFTLQPIWIGEGPDPGQSDSERIFGSARPDLRRAVLRSGEAPARKDRLTPAQQLAIDTYQTAAGEAGIWAMGGAFCGVHVDAWRAAFYKKHTGDNDASKRQAFHRVRTDLVNTGKMMVNDDVYLVTIAAVQTAIMDGPRPQSPSPEPPES